VLFLTCMTLSGIGAVAAYFAPAFVTLVKASGQGTPQVPIPHARQQQAESAASVAAASDTQAFTVLLLGSDNDSKFKGGVLTQSMILVRVDPSTKQAVMLSIPRDLWVQLPNGSMGKIDQASGYGGLTAAVAAVEENFGIHVDDWAWVGLQGLINIINYLGGVDVVTTNPVMDDYYPADIQTKDAYGYQRIAVLPGPQHLDGIQALEYARSRHGDLDEDFGRSLRQQQLLLAIKAKARYLKPSDLPGLVSQLNGQFKTSMSLAQIQQLLPLVQVFSNSADIKHIILDGSYTSGIEVDGQDALQPNWSLILPLVHQYFG
jgi:LCP family protein required for cell wall assembly